MIDKCYILSKFFECYFCLPQFRLQKFVPLNDLVSFSDSSLTLVHCIQPLLLGLYHRITNTAVLQLLNVIIIIKQILKVQN